MNKRIKQLALQAGLKWKEQPPHYTNTNNPIDFPVSANRDLEKFAELIVHQMLEIADAYTEVFQTDRDRALIEHIKKSVKTHFGVKE